MVKAVVVGAGGALGGVLAARLPKAFETVSLTHAELDISRRNDVMSRIQELKPDVIFNAAGVSDVDLCETDRWQAYLVNRDGAKHLSIAAAESNATLVVFSSDLVFDGAKTSPYREEDSPNPLSIYGDTKLGAELAAMSQSTRNLIIRTGWFFDRDGKNYLSQLMEKQGADEVVLGFDDQRGQPTYLPDFVDAVMELVKQNQTGVWNVASAGEASPFEFARAVYQAIGRDTGLVRPLRRGQGARSALRPRYSVLDLTKLQLAGIHPRPWIEALRACLKPA